MKIIQMLGWKLNDINGVLDRISDQGFDYVQINPIQPLKEERLDLWWMSYQPIDFSIGNIYGSKRDLENLCNEACKRNINIVSDVICNHMAGCDDGSLYPHYKVNEALRNNKYFWKEPVQVRNWKNRYEVIHYCMGLPGLNVENYDLQNIIISFLNELIDTGINGFRFDAAKSIGLPSEGNDFWPRVIYLLKKYGLNIYGEVIFESDKLQEYTKYMKVITNEEFYNKDSIIKYSENHDSYYDLKYTASLSDNEINNCYMDLCENYPNTLYFVRPYSDAWKESKVRDANILKRK